jgi:hypothetical protein
MYRETKYGAKLREKKMCAGNQVFVKIAFKSMRMEREKRVM